MKVAIAGVSGFVGSFLCSFFDSKGWEVSKIGIKDFENGLAEKLSGADIVINLCGAPIIGRWSDAYKKILVSSRMETTKKIVDAIGILSQKPKVFFCASAVGYYEEGDNDEFSYKKANDFLGNLCANWESEARQVEGAGVKCANMRFGIVVGKNGGAIGQMLPIFKAGLGGKIGSGKQGFSWIHLSDLARAIEFIYERELEGAFNFTAPHPTTNAGLTKALGSALHRPTIFPVPEFALKLLYSEGAKVLTSGQRVYPKRLIDEGFEFEYKTIDVALKDAVL